MEVFLAEKSKLEWKFFNVHVLAVMTILKIKGKMIDVDFRELGGNLSLGLHPGTAVQRQACQGC